MIQTGMSWTPEAQGPQRLIHMCPWQGRPEGCVRPKSLALKDLRPNKQQEGADSGSYTVTPEARDKKKYEEPENRKKRRPEIEERKLTEGDTCLLGDGRGKLSVPVSDTPLRFLLNDKKKHLSFLFA